MGSTLFPDLASVFPLSVASSTVRGRSLPCTFTYYSRSTFSKPTVIGGSVSFRNLWRRQLTEFRRPVANPLATAGTTNSVPFLLERTKLLEPATVPTKDNQREGIYTVGDFMTAKEHLHVVRPTTTVDEALETLVEKRVTGFPVVDDDWKLVGVVSDYDLLALDSISGGGQQDTNLFPVVDSTWKTFNEIQKLLSKTNGKVVGDLMTPAPLVVHETTNIEDAARLLLKTKYRRLPVVDGEGKLIGIITRGDVVRGALLIKKSEENI